MWLKLIVLVLLAVYRTDSLEISGIYDLGSVQGFLQDLMGKLEGEQYKLESLVSNETKNAILKIILSDSVAALAELDKYVSADPYEKYWYENFCRLLKDMQESEVKSGTTRRSFTPLLRSLEERWRVVNKHVELLVSFHKSNHSKDLVGVCPVLYGVMKFLKHDYYSKSIATVYKTFIDDVFQAFSYKTHLTNCGQRSSLREGLFHFFRQVMTSYLKEFVLYWFVNVAKSRCLDENQPAMLGDLLGTLEGKFSQNIRITKDTLNFYQFTVFRCDPNDDEKYNREWYYELEKMVQTVVINEQYLTTTRSCNHNCDLNAIKDTIEHQDCREFRDCRLVQSDLEVCKNDENYNSRRYQWIKDSKGNVYGNGSLKCYRKESVRSCYDGSNMRFCEYCMCTCVKKQKQGYHVDTVISFREQVSDTGNNKAITGVRFAKQGHMIHIQIKEYYLGPPKYSQHDPWKPLEDIEFDETIEKFIIKNGSNIPLTLEVDYAHPDDGFYLDDIIAPLGFVVTGARFRFAKATPGSHAKSRPIELQIRVSPMDFINRRIIDDHRTHWMSAKPKKQRAELELNAPDLPTKWTKNEVDSYPGQFIRFRASDLKKDAGQSTVPFFCALEAEGWPGFPLGGMGVHHRGRRGSGGFLALKIFDLDLSYYYRDESIE